MSTAAKDVERARLADMATCDVCGEPHGKDRVITFLRVTVQQAIIDVDALSKTAGLTMMMGGSAALADVFLPHRGEVMLPEELRETHTLCHGCAMETPVGRLFESERGSDDA